MKVLLDGTVFEEPHTGVARVTLGLYNACMHLEPSLEINVLHRRHLAESLPPGMNTRRTGRIFSHKWWRRVALPLAMRTASGHIAHFPCNGDVPSLPGSLPVVVTLHDVIPLMIPGYFSSPEAERRYKAGIQRDLERASLIITVSAYSRSEILRHFSVLTEPVVITPGVTLPGEILDDRSFDTGSPYFIYVGGYDRRKGLEQLLRVFNELVRTSETSASLILAGMARPLTGEFQNLLQQGLDSGRVKQTGYVDDGVLSQLLRHAIALVFPSRYEGFGLPALEAMASGCPVITTRSTSLPEVCGDAALYFDHLDDRSLAGAMQRVEQSSELRQQYAQRGRDRSRLFDWETSAGKFLAALEPVVRRSYP